MEQTNLSIEIPHVPKDIDNSKEIHFVSEWKNSSIEIHHVSKERDNSKELPHVSEQTKPSIRIPHAPKEKDVFREDNISKEIKIMSKETDCFTVPHVLKEENISKEIPLMSMETDSTDLHVSEETDILKEIQMTYKEIDSLIGNSDDLRETTTKDLCTSDIELKIPWSSQKNEIPILLDFEPNIDEIFGRYLRKISSYCETPRPPHPFC